MDISNYWKKIREDLFIIESPHLEDFRAVVGAKTSRAADLDIKSNIDREGLKKFLKMNLAGYGHASIGEMSFPTIHHRGFGWVGAWLVEDDPLFIGQEVSTRAVDMRLIPHASEICYDSPKFLEENHNFFWMLFNELEKTNKEQKGYKYDKIRWALPGTIRLGVTSMMNARVAMRHFERLISVPFCSDIASNFMKGIEACSENVYEALIKGNRTPHYRWRNLEIVKVDKNNLDFKNTIEIKPEFDLEKNDLFKNVSKLEPRPKKDYLDPIFKQFTPFRLKIICSIASARDWHRHRSVMPWTIKLVEDKEGNPIIAPWYLADYDIKNLNKQMISAYKKAKESISDENCIQVLYSLPYGSLVEIECFASLPELLYILELRASAGGNNFEYKAHAIEGLNQLCNIMGRTFTEYHSLNRVLFNEEIL